ncbi:hypothetical protein PCL1606_08320 [Pseudomonas chlororaphis]|uniref:Uncharacterized protein n=1 Tax=Pseudomonas chlororaphis TaxID=587753 RepID=A0A0D5XT98_9PSED|nr:hypothetical protein PCL1606_08320 [Pseudomonas chlororaphis]
MRFYGCVQGRFFSRPTAIRVNSRITPVAWVRKLLCEAMSFTTFSGKPAGWR